MGRFEAVLFFVCAWLVFGTKAEPLATDEAYAACLNSPACVSLYCQTPSPSRKAFNFIVGPATQTLSNSTLTDLFALAATQGPRCGIGQACEWSLEDNLVQCVGTSRSGTPSASTVMIFIAAVITAMAVGSASFTLKQILQA
jgi:hypothetical protein